MSQENQKPKRRWLRFSLRTFLIVVTIFCVWLGWYVYRAERQREVVRWVLENGGEVSYDYEFSSDGYRLVDSQPPVPTWLDSMLGVDYFSSIAGVSLPMPVTDLKPLASLSSLKKLKLFAASENDLTPLSKLTNLKRLFLVVKTPVTDLRPLASLSSLEHLRLLATPDSDMTNFTKPVGLRTTTFSYEEIEKLKQALPNCCINR